MQDLEPIRVFLEVAEQRSFAAAARNLRKTPATVTRVIARLEQDLGLQLFVRTTRKVSLTSAGALVAARYKPVVQSFDRVTDEISRATRPDRGRISVNVPLSFGLRLLPGLVESFRLAYPNIELSIGLTDRFVDIVEEDWDLAIRISTAPTDKSTIWRKVCEVPRSAIASPHLFQRINRPDRPEDLDQRYCLSYGTDHAPETWHFASGSSSRSVPAGREVVSNNGDFLHSLVLSGAGIAVLPDFIFNDDLRAGLVERVLPDWTVSRLWLALYYPPYETLPPLVATFSDFFEAYLKEADGFDFDVT